MSAHNEKDCRDCQEISRTAELLANAGHNALGTKLVFETCPSMGGKPLDVLIEDYNVELDKVRREIPGTVQLPITKEDAKYPFGPPLTIPTGFKRYSTIKPEEIDACYKLVKSCESPDFMRKATETVMTWAHERWEEVNKAHGLERDGKRKREESEAAAKPAESFPATRPQVELNGAYSERKFFTRRDLVKAKLSTGIFVITHVIENARARHTWIGPRGSDCPKCQSMPAEVELRDPADVNRHGKTKKKQTVDIMRERWESSQ